MYSRKKINTVQPDFPKRLKRCIEESGITQSKLAEECALTKKMVTNWLSGKNQPREECLEVMADLFGCDIEWLKGYDVPKDKHLRKNASGYADPTAYAALKNIEKTEKKEGNKMDIKMDFNKGEIWEAKTVKGTKLVAIIKPFENYCTCIQLFDTNRFCYEERINAQGIKFYNPSMVSYEYNDKFERFIRVMKDEEYMNMLDSISKALCLGSVFVQSEAAEECKMLKAKNDSLKDDVDALKKEIEDIKMAYEDADAKAAAEHAEKMALENQIGELKHRLEEEKNAFGIAEDECDKLKAEIKELVKQAAPKCTGNPLENVLLAVEAERNVYKDLYNQMLERLIG